MNKKLLFTFFFFGCMTYAQVPNFVKVEGGSFTMGDDFGYGVHDETLHKVTLKSYYIAKTEVTVGQYRKYCLSVGVNMPSELPETVNDYEPIRAVSYLDAIGYCEWLSKELDRNVMLPTEAQWEFAARGGKASKGYKYSGDSNLNLVAWNRDNSGGKVHIVARKKPNELGLFDMSGNVYEWCRDWYGDYFKLEQDPLGRDYGSDRVLRGGSFNRPAAHCRIANRSRYRPDSRNINRGFRVVSF